MPDRPSARMLKAIGCDSGRIKLQYLRAVHVETLDLGNDWTSSRRLAGLAGQARPDRAKQGTESKTCTGLDMVS